MTSQLQTVLEIAGIGTILLFIALVALVVLMYLLTMPWPFVSSAKQAEDTSSPTTVNEELLEQESQKERDRQLRAVSLAVAVACAQADQNSAFLTETRSDWRLLHRSRRLGQQQNRARVRS